MKIAAIILLSGCNGTEPVSNNSNNAETTIHALPQSSGDASCYGQEDPITGGDIFATAARIVVGEVTNVEVLDFGIPIEDCLDTEVVLSLRVTMRVEENLKGSGDSVNFYLGTMPMDLWGSQPQMLHDDVWLPRNTQASEPSFRATPTIGWTGNAGVQPGQRLLVFLWDVDGLTPELMPLADVDDAGNLTFQNEEMNGSCFVWTDGFPGKTLAELKAALAKPAMADPQLFNFNIKAPKYSGCNSVPSAPDAGDPDAG